MRSTISNPDLNSQYQHQQHQRQLEALDTQQQQQPPPPSQVVSLGSASSSPSTPPLGPSSLGPSLGITRPKHAGIRAVSASIPTTGLPSRKNNNHNNSIPPRRRVVSSSSTPPLRNSVLSSTLISKTAASNHRVTATRSRFPPRTPLARRDENEKVDHNDTSKVAAMPLNDKHQRQPMSAFSNSTQKPGVSRSTPTPLTPKIATVTTPVSSRFSNQPNTTPITTPLGKRSHARGASRDDTAAGICTPISSFLSTNITPRSGSRQSRVDSTHSTPTGTPTADRSDPYTTDYHTPVQGLGISGGGAGGEQESKDPEGATSAAMPRRAVVSFSPAPSGVSTPTKRESRFFYASDANANKAKLKQQQAPKQQQQQAPNPVRPSIAQHKQSSFFHANGDSIDAPSDRTSSDRSSRPNSIHTPSAGTASPSITSPTLQPSGKFFYANGAGVDAVERKKASPQNGASTPINSVSVSASVTRSANTTPSSALNYGGARPSSPTKIAQPSSVFVAHKNISLPSLATRGPPSLTAAAPTAASSNASVAINRVVPAVVEAPSRPSPLGHTRADSIPTVEQIISMSKLMSPQLSSECSTPVSLPPAPTSGGEYFSEPEDHGSDGLQSPTKSQHSNDQLTELVANARRERKVQDLEITNASLGAINRTLERQLRKQQAELRSYRRLSRSGRLSLTSAPSSRVASESLTVPPSAEVMDLSALDEVDEQEEQDKEQLMNEEEEEDEEDDEDDEDEEDEMDTSGLSGTDSVESLSPEEQAIRDAKHQVKDERRLKLDLTKHQQLLVDSQRMNQSLKRCLNWSDMMIRDGKRALSYSVRVSDVELGGRILPPPDEYGEDVSISGIEDFDDTCAEDYASTTQLSHSPRQQSVEPEMWAKVPQDRDSGIEMQTERNEEEDEIV